MVSSRTERTYVKGLQELVDIYIKPASATVTVLSGVSVHEPSSSPESVRRWAWNFLREGLFICA